MAGRTEGDRAPADDERPSPMAMEPERLVPALLRSLGDDLGGDSVAFNWCNADGTLTVVGLHEPSAAAAVDAANVVGRPMPRSGTLSDLVVQTGEPIRLGGAEIAAMVDRSFPEPLRGLHRRFPVRSAMVLPVVAGGRVHATLVVMRRDGLRAHTDVDEARAARTAGRLAALFSFRWAPTEPVPTAPSGRPVAGRPLWHLWLRDLAVGSAGPLAVWFAMSRAPDASQYRPGIVMLAVMIAMAVLVGMRAGLVAAVVGALIIWVEYTGVPGDWGARSPQDLASISVYVASTVGVLELLRRVQRERLASARQQRVNDALMDGAPVGIGLLDADLRFVSVNRRLAEINELQAEEHVGLRPGEVHPLAGELYEPLVERVRDDGVALLDERLSIELPDAGVERHWRAGFYPVSGDGGSVLGVGMTMEDITGDVISRRRSERLLQLARDLAATIDRDSLSATMTSFLADAYRGRSYLAYVEDDGTSLRCAPEFVGYPPEVERDWPALTIPVHASDPVAEACREHRMVTVASAQEFGLRYPDSERLRRVSGDRACLCVPVEDPASGAVLAVLVVGWPHDRVVTDTSRTLADTVASLGALALNRLQLSDDLGQDRFRSALDSMLDHVAIASSVRDGSGRIEDFRLDFLNAPTVDGAGRSADQLIGRRVTDLYPAWRTSGMFDRVSQVVATGVPFVAHRLAYSDTLPDGTVIDGHWSIQVVRFGDGYMAASRDVTEVVRLEEAELEARRVADRERLAVQILQQAALPKQLPEVEGLELHAVYEPAVASQPVGGDWFDAFRLGDDQLALVIADVAGHGPEAATFMVQVRNIFRAVAVERCGPDEVLHRVNEVTVGLQDPGGLFVTACFAVLDLATSTVSWSSAGHLPLLLCRGSSCGFLDQEVGLPLAIAAGADYPVHQSQLLPGDRLLLFTDGLVERRGESIDDGLARLAVVAAGAAHHPPSAALQSLVGAVEAQGDDLAVLLVERSP